MASRHLFTEEGERSGENRPPCGGRGSSDVKAELTLAQAMALMQTDSRWDSVGERDAVLFFEIARSQSICKKCLKSRGGFDAAMGRRVVVTHGLPSAEPAPMLSQIPLKLAYEEGGRPEDLADVLKNIKHNLTMIETCQTQTLYTGHEGQLAHARRRLMEAQALLREVLKETLFISLFGEEL